MLLEHIHTHTHTHVQKPRRRYRHPLCGVFLLFQGEKREKKKLENWKN